MEISKVRPQPLPKSGGFKTHGMSKSPEYAIWAGMRYRCSNPRNKAYSYYGGRGIRVCERWQKSFQEFYKDMGKKPSAKHTLERIDNNGDYEPKNCRWATVKEQSHNRRVRRDSKYEYTGVFWRERDGVWIANIGVDYKVIHLGSFNNKEDAIKARKEAESKFFGGSE